MEQGPLPPHERTWRHPSELAAHEHAVARSQTATATTRAFAFTTGTLGLLAVGLLMVAVTPSRTAAPVAISATTTPTGNDGGTAPAATATSSIRNPVALRNRSDLLATPIGEGRFALVTATDVATMPRPADVGEAVQVAVPSGTTHDARIVGLAGDTVLVELERSEPGVALAEHPPAGHDVVTVLAEPPVTIVLDDLATLVVDEGTAVLDRAGGLVGLCTRGDGDETRLVVVDGKLVDEHVLAMAEQRTTDQRTIDQRTTDERVTGQTGGATNGD